MPKISAVMALYNTPIELFTKTVKSILNQDFTDFELIIIDDASSINYDEIIKKFNDERIVYSKLEKNAGPGHARNTGIKMAQGEYIAITDSDDIYYPQRFSKQAEFLDKNQEISLISAAFKQSNNGKIPKAITKIDEINTLMLFNSRLANPLIMFRKKIFIENNLFYPEDKTFGEDYELWIDAMFKGIKMVNLPEVLMIYTRRKGQLSKEKNDKQKRILKSLYKKILSQLDITPSDKELETHHKIYAEDVSHLTEKEITDWFQKIINSDKLSLYFNKNKLNEMETTIINKLKLSTNKLFKIKIGNYNLFLTKNLKIEIQKRS